MEDTKNYIWMATTAIIMVILFVTGHWIIALASPVISFILWALTLE